MQNLISYKFLKKIASEYVAPETKIFPKPLMKKKVKKDADLISFLEESSETNDHLNHGLF